MFRNVRPWTFLNSEFFKRKTRYCLKPLTSCQRSDVLGVRLKLAANTDTDDRGSAQKRCFLLKQKTRRPTKYTDVFCWAGQGCTFFITTSQIKSKETSIHIVLISIIIVALFYKINALILMQICHILCRIPIGLLKSALGHIATCQIIPARFFLYT